MAGIKLHEKILNNSVPPSMMGHFEILHVTISDLKRAMAFLTYNLNGDTKKHNLGEQNFRFIQTLSDHARAKGVIAILGCPCNTYHSPCMFDRMVALTDDFNAKLAAQFKGSGPAPGTVKIVHMVSLIATHLIQAGFKTIGLLSSSGTRNFRIYRDVFERAGVTLLEVDDAFQTKVDDCIVNPEDGIIVKSCGTKRVVETLSKGVRSLKERGAEVVILGCTELPIALNMAELHGIPIVDAMETLARSMIYAAEPTMLKPESKDSIYYIDFDQLQIPFATKDVDTTKRL